MSDLVLNFSNFRYHDNKTRSKVNINDTIKLADFQTPGLMHDSPDSPQYPPYLFISQAESIFLFKNNHLVTMATRVGTGCHIKDIVKLGDPYNAPLSAIICVMSFTQARYSQFCVEISSFLLPWQQGSV